MTELSTPAQAASIIKALLNGRSPEYAVVLGSGQGRFADDLANPIRIPFSDLPGFSDTGVVGQQSELVIGDLSGKTIACLLGRSHYYAHKTYEPVINYVRTLRLIGCDKYIATNASGSLDPTVTPGSLVLITDHINFQGNNPLLGPNDDEFGTRFPPMDKAYHPELLSRLRNSAAKKNITLHEGTYISVLGPCYETAAEIRAFRLLGADVIGMSTVPEVIVANHCGFNVAVVATVTNLATGLTAQAHDHHNVVAAADAAADKVLELLTTCITSD